MIKKKQHTSPFFYRLLVLIFVACGFCFVIKQDSNNINTTASSDLTPASEITQVAAIAAIKVKVPENFHLNFLSNDLYAVSTALNTEKKLSIKSNYFSIENIYSKTILNSFFRKLLSNHCKIIFPTC